MPVDFVQRPVASWIGQGQHVGETLNHCPGDKWLPGTVQATSGQRMVHVTSPEGDVRRHADQLRLRDAISDERRTPQTDVVEGENAVSPASPQQQPSHQATTQPSDSQDNDVTDPSIPPRRSTRQKHPPVRLFYKGRGVLGSD